MTKFTKKLCCTNSRIFNKKLMMPSKNKINFRNEKSVRYFDEAEFEFLHAELGLISFKKQIWWSFSDNTCGRLMVYHAQSEEDYQSLASILN